MRPALCRSLIAALCGAAAIAGQHRAPVPIAIDYPIDGTVFPPELTAPAFQWRDAAVGATHWTIEVTFADGSPALRIQTPGDRMRVGDVDPRAIAETNELPRLSAQRAAARVWRPHPQTWDVIKSQSVKGPATVTISGLGSGNELLSSGRISISTSRRPGRRAHFLPGRASDALRDREGRHQAAGPEAPAATSPGGCATSRSHAAAWSWKGSTPAPTATRSPATAKRWAWTWTDPTTTRGCTRSSPSRPRMSIRNRDVISWKTFRDQTAADKTIGFMSQVSPDGLYVVTATQGRILRRELQGLPFPPGLLSDARNTGLLQPADGRMRALPGADDPRYVQANAVWSPDGRYLVFVRARRPRIPIPRADRWPSIPTIRTRSPSATTFTGFPSTSGRGGVPEPIAGASQNGMSKAFPKVSPDGRWIVFVQCRNGQLMRPDGQLYIVPAAGGEARRMRCNTPLMNSWHSFSPNGRWLVFTSKSRSPYTQMFLTHIDEDGNDSPAVLVENAPQPIEP